MARPSEMDSPWPSDPVAASMPGHRTRSGCPCSGEPNFRSVESQSRGIVPTRASAAYTIGTQCPFDRMNRSRSGQSGSFGRSRILWRYSAATMSAADSVPPGCPDPAFTSIRMSSIRSCRASSFSSLISASRSICVAWLISGFLVSGLGAASRRY